MAALLKAKTAWKDAMPDWVAALATACDNSSQNKVARKLERSPALVSTVLSNSYKGDMSAVEDLVRGVFMAGTLACPVFGDIGLQQCRKWRGRARSFQNVNSQYVQMYKACNRCPVHLSEEEKGDE